MVDWAADSSTRLLPGRTLGNYICLGHCDAASASRNGSKAVFLARERYGSFTGCAEAEGHSSEQGQIRKSIVIVT